MGRQVQLSMLPGDRDALLREIRSHAPVDVVLHDGDAVDVQPLTSIPDTSDPTMILWNKQLMPTLQRKWIDSATPGYYRVDQLAFPVLEFSMSMLTVDRWQFTLSTATTVTLEADSTVFNTWPLSPGLHQL